MNTELTRSEAIEEIGKNEVERVEEKNCHPTNSGTPNEPEKIWEASIETTDNNGNSVELTACYCTTAEEEQRIADAGSDGAVIDWEIDYYELTAI